jgi:predicted RNase H-like nuclease (RuvC/YqgF family)
MSDTPRTYEQINGKPCTRFEILAGDSLRNAAVPSEFARTIERELNAANAEIERLTNKVAQLYEGAEEAKQRIKRLEEELNELRSNEAGLLNSNGELERRIKRILEAGDKMCPWSERVGQEFWIQAKEAK